MLVEVLLNKVTFAGGATGSKKRYVSYIENFCHKDHFSFDWENSTYDLIKSHVGRNTVNFHLQALGLYSFVGGY